MKIKRLKIIRVGVSLLFLVLISFLFLDFRDAFSPAFAGGVLYLQFVPSILKFVNTAALGAAGFILVLVLTALIGRVYCSAVCPLGILQDLAGFAARKIRKRGKYQFSKPHDAARYSILALTALAFLAGSGLVLNLLDPFSSFGRVFSNLVRPVVMVLNNVAAPLLVKAGIHTLYQVRWAEIAPVSVGIALATLAVITWLAATRGRFYCNTICPVGALLGLLSKKSILRIGLDPDVCTGCTLCEGVCKSGCIDSKNRTVDYSRCVGCFNCLTVCPKGGVRFENNWAKRNPKAAPDSERREFLLNSGIYLAGLTGVAGQVKTILQSKPTTIPLLRTSPVSPPGSVSIEHFTGICTACHLCVSACPSHVLTPSFLEYGFVGLMQPRMNFSSGHCNYDCTKCMDICPSGAILPLPKEKKKLTQLGVAKFIKENCVVYTDNTNCGACSEHCPTKAVDMVPYPNSANRKLVIPEVKPEICIGCGGCEYACPTKPYKAIYVDGNPVHKVAQKPVVKKIEQKVDESEDFPF